MKPVFPIHVFTGVYIFQKFNVLLLDFPEDIRLRLAIKCHGDHLLSLNLFVVISSI